MLYWGNPEVTESNQVTVYMYAQIRVLISLLQVTSDCNGIHLVCPLLKTSWSVFHSCLIWGCTPVWPPAPVERHRGVHTWMSQVCCSRNNESENEDVCVQSSASGTDFVSLLSVLCQTPLTSQTSCLTTPPPSQARPPSQRSPMLPRAVSRCHGNRGQRRAPQCPPMSSRPSGTSVTYGPRLHLVTPNVVVGAVNQVSVFQSGYSLWLTFHSNRYMFLHVHINANHWHIEAHFANW